MIKPFYVKYLLSYIFNEFARDDHLSSAFFTYIRYVIKINDRRETVFAGKHIVTLIVAEAIVKRNERECFFTRRNAG